MAKPDKILIPLDEYHFENVGRLSDGTQVMVFVTGAFPTGMQYYLGEDWQHKKKWLAVVHRFDADGNHLGSESRLGALDIKGRQVAGDKAFGHLEAMFADLCASGPPEFCDIWVRLFSVEIDGVTHGLFYEQSEEEPEPGDERGGGKTKRTQLVFVVKTTIKREQRAASSLFFCCVLKTLAAPVLVMEENFPNRADATVFVVSYLLKAYRLTSLCKSYLMGTAYNIASAYYDNSESSLPTSIFEAVERALAKRTVAEERRGGVKRPRTGKRRPGKTRRREQ